MRPFHVLEKTIADHGIESNKTARTDRVKAAHHIYGAFEAVSKETPGPRRSLPQIFKAGLDRLGIGIVGQDGFIGPDGLGLEL